MKKTYVNVQKEFCGECSLALMHFIGRIKGVDAISAEGGKVMITFDDAIVSEEELLKVTRESIETMGYNISKGKT